MSARSVEDRVALVTGANRGIGRAIAEELGINGAYVVGTSRSQEGVKSIEEMLAGIGAEGLGIELDIAQYDQINDRLRTIVEAAGRPVSILVNNAGVSRNGLAIGMKEHFDEVIDTNLKGTFRVTQATGRQMIKAVRKNQISDADIVTLGSVVGEVGEPGQVAYGMSKAALENMTKTLSREWPEVRLSIVHPGYVDTDMTSEAEIGSDRIHDILALTDSGRPLSPRHIAIAVQELIEQGETGTILSYDDGIKRNMKNKGIIPDTF